MRHLSTGSLIFETASSTFLVEVPGMGEVLEFTTLLEALEWCERADAKPEAA